eukprot:15235946-Alexandrium_andersonii.AAC.1
MRLPEAAIQSVMAAAGYQYECEPETQALLFLYPPTRTVTGRQLGAPQISRRTERKRSQRHH